MRAALLPALVLGLAVASCEGGEGPTGPEGPPGPGAPSASSIEISPSSSIIDDGETLGLTATVLAEDGSIVDGSAVTWASDDATVASLSPSSGATVSPTEVLVTGTGQGTATVTASVGSASAESSVACCLPVEVSVRFAVRSGTTINPTGSPGIFDDDTDEAFLEFPLDFPDLPVTVEFRVRDIIVGSSDPTIEFNVATYAANGVANTSDFGSGTFLTTLTIEPGALQEYELDVTEEVAALKEAGATHIGIRFYDSTLGQLSVPSGAILDGS